MAVVVFAMLVSVKKNIQIINYKLLINFSYSGNGIGEFQKKRQQQA